MLLRGRILAAAGGGDRRRWRALIVEPGRSKNGPFYAPAMLREAVASGLFDNRPVHVFPEVDTKGRPIKRGHVLQGDPRGDEFVGRTVLNVVGRTCEAQYVEGVGVVSDIELLPGHPSADEVHAQLCRMAEGGALGLVGLSMDASGDLNPRNGWAVLRRVASVDVVTDPAAGGRVLHRIAAAFNPGSYSPMLKEVLTRARERFPRLTEGLAETATEWGFARHVAARAKADEPARAELVKALSLDEAAAKRLAEADALAMLDHGHAFVSKVSADHEAEVETSAGGGDAATALAEARRLAEAAKDEAEKIRTDLRLTEALGSAKLPDEAAARVRAQFAGRTATQSEIANAIRAEREYVDKIAGRAVRDVTGVRVVEASEDKLAAVLSHMLNPTQVRLPEGVTTQPFMASFKEFLYQQFGVRPEAAAFGGQPARVRMAEAIDSTGFSKVFADALNRAVLAAYSGNADYTGWKKIVRHVPYSDFRTNHVIQVGYYGNLPDVAKGGTYLALTSPTDREETIALAKKGGMESITMEDMLNDDLNLWQTMIQRIGQAAMETAYEAVMKLTRVATMPTMQDTYKLGSASRTPVNLGTAVLSADATGKTNLIASIVAMMKATGGSGQKKGIVPRYAVIPLEKVEQYAYVVQSLRGGVTGTDLPDAIQKMLAVSTPEPIIDLGASNTTDWSLIADPLRAEVFRHATLGGRDAPEIFLADDQRFGSIFTRDQLDLKVRFIFAVAAVDFAGFYINDAAS